jgi:hypothetical protein
MFPTLSNKGALGVTSVIDGAGGTVACWGVTGPKEAASGPVPIPLVAFTVKL